MLRPHGHRVLIEPDAPPERTDSGLVLPEDRAYVPTSGTVVEIGSGSLREFQIRRATIQRCLAIVAETLAAHPERVIDELQLYLLKVTAPHSAIAVGDHVVFPPDTGMVITHERRPYVLLREDEIVIVETEAAAV